MDDPDAGLLARWSAGDRGAGASLLDRWFAPIERFFRNKLPDAIETQDDLIQSTFAAVLDAAGRFRGEGSFRSFLFSIAYNTLRKHYERGRRDANIDWGTCSVHDLATGPFSEVARRDELAIVAEGLRQLPLELQTALELAVDESMTAAEIASCLGLPVGTVKTRLRRAKALLRAHVENAGVDPIEALPALSAVEGDDAEG